MSHTKLLALSLAALALGSGARAQTAPRDAAAALDAQDLAKVRGVSATPPARVPIKDTDYPVPMANVFFVSPGAPEGAGKADSPGTSASAPTTLEKAIASAPTGATIVLRGGTYRGVSRLTLRRKLTLQPFPHENVWIKGSIVAGGWVKDDNAAGPAWRKDNWTHKFGPPVRIGPDYINPKYPLAIERDMVFINDKALTQVATRADVKPGTFFVDGKKEQLFIGDNPANKTVEATAFAQGLGLYKNANGDASGTLVRGLGFAHFGDQGISVGAPDVVLENNTVAWNGQRGIYVYRGADGVRLQGNLVSCNGRVGLRASSARRLVVENNTFSYNNVENWRTAWDAAGVKITNMAYPASDGLVFRNNVVERNYATAVWMDIDCNHAVVVRNQVRYNQGIGIFFEISEHAIIAFNVAHHNGTGVMVSNSKYARVVNNTLASNATNVVVKQTGRKNSYPETIAGAATGEVFITRGNVFKNNLLANVREGSTNPLFDGVSNPRDPSSVMTTASDYNAYHRSQPTQPANVVKWSPDGKSVVNFPTLAAFREATGFEKNGLAIDAATSPFFVDEAKDDFRLRPGSPAIGRGEALPDDIAKAAQKPAGPVHLGALDPAPALAAKKTP